ncbi:hypothetical protein B0H10DRAFT_2447074 [Mycena sp. CBHHK59/15]|nr:hypothetical protein B0H10DRAFT_2447074 [Mycena sp. CBHHK59/15]
MTIPLFLLALCAVAHAQADDQVPLAAALTDVWVALSAQVGGRLFEPTPFAQLCFANATSPECITVQTAYQNESARAACGRVHLGAFPGVTAGAGVQIFEVFEFAEKYNITLVGGSDATVGFTGGFVQGGGTVCSHLCWGSPPTVRRHPRRAAPHREHMPEKDLFFALRGGGGGTFGVVLEATILATPAAPMQVIVVTWAAKDAARTAALWALLAEHMLGWADAGWGGAAGGGVEGAMALGGNAGGGCIALPSRMRCNAILTRTPPPPESRLQRRLTSRLVLCANFVTPASHSVLVDALLGASAVGPLMIIQITAPTAAASGPRAGAHKCHARVRASYKVASAAMDGVRAITPDAAYLNEADMYEPNHEVSFWGDHYPELVSIKMKYDPDRLLDCWQCGESKSHLFFSLGGLHGTRATSDNADVRYTMLACLAARNI